MTDRERWTVYPLLFLAIGLAMRAVLVPPEAMGELEVVRLVCREIVVQDGDRRVMLHLGRVVGGGGRIEINDAEGNALMSFGSTPPEGGDSTAGDGADTRLDRANPPAAIEFAGPDGKIVRRITSDDGQ